jgi:hypothetical protein
MLNKPSRCRITVITALSILLLAGIASAQETPSPYAKYDGVFYYFAHGTLNSSTATNGGANTGLQVLDAKVCIKAQLRPELARGRINLVGLIDNNTYLEMDFDDILSPNGVLPGVSSNFTLGADLGQAPPLRTRIGAWGPIFMTANGRNVTDPVSSQEDLSLQGAFFVTQDGERDDDTGAHLASTQKGDTEMHLRIRNDPDGAPVTLTRRISQGGDLPAGGFSPNEAYSNRFLVYNPKFGGTATAQISFNSNAPAGLNELTFTFSSPTGKLMGETKLTAAALSAGSGTVEFPLNEFGSYIVEVRGKVALSSYTINLAMAPPKSLDLRFWWEEVSVGEQANKDMTDCRKQIGVMATADRIVGRPPPPSWFMEKVIVGIVGATAGVLLVTKIIVDGVAQMQLKRRFGR